MSVLHVCSLGLVPEMVERTGATHLVTLLGKESFVPRPPAIDPQRHLFLAMSDIVEMQAGYLEAGHVLPRDNHVARLIEFVKAWERQAPMVIHCYAGVSRSTAAAYITACALQPDRDELELADLLRAKSPTATPNRRLVDLADRMLEREGRMVRAIESIGRGADCYEGVPFALEIG